MDMSSMNEHMDNPVHLAHIFFLISPAMLIRETSPGRIQKSESILNPKLREIPSKAKAKTANITHKIAILKLLLI
jgi:hypothetical protein